MRMAGASMASAPSSVSRAARPLDCACARVTTTDLPSSGRRSTQANPSRSRATGPTTVIAGGSRPASATRAAMSVSVPVTVR